MSQNSDLLRSIVPNMTYLNAHTHEDIGNMILKPHLILTSFGPTWDNFMWLETNAYVSMQGLQNDDLIYPPIPYVLMNAKVVLFWEMLLSMSRSSPDQATLSRNTHTLAITRTHTQITHAWHQNVAKHIYYQCPEAHVKRLTPQLVASAWKYTYSLKQALLFSSLKSPLKITSVDLYSQAGSGILRWGFRCGYSIYV